MPIEVTEVELMVKRKNRLAEERKAAEFRAVEAQKLGEADRMRQAAASARTSVIARMREADAARLEAEARRAAGEAERAEARAKVFARDEDIIAVRLAHSERSVALADEHSSDWTIT
ncbi:hypothetical protein [Gryllotalpicola ginsengisoli]|uniref:hypothetical protein n=1 Tax=Gryllotalpicola ginsengisoli TaxID=444608 RepID=UPI0003B6590F|nr:hypothetical protein [Gryllotalpicola ginsengisoli]